MTQNQNRKYLFFLPLLLVLPAVLVACSSQAVAQSEQKTRLASLDSMPEQVKNAPVKVRQAYQFAVANPEIMKQIPCYCGCGKMGHTSNYSCYVSGVDANGKVKYDTHALGCSICVDITQDTLRLLKEGKTVQEIKLYVDQTYVKYGPSNMK